MKTEIDVGTLTINGDDGIWEIPVLRDQDRGIVEPDVLCCEIVDGVATLARSGDHIEISRSGPIRGWGNLDCEDGYYLGSSLTSAAVMEALAAETGLRLPE